MRTSSSVIFSCVFFILSSASLCRTIVGDGGHTNKNVGVRDMGVHGIVHFLRAFHAQRVHALGIGQGGGTGDQRDVRAGLHGRLRHGITHLAGAAIGQPAHRVDGFPGGTGGDHDAQAVEFAGGEQLRHQRDEFRRLQHAAGPDFAAGLRAFRRAENPDAVFFERRQVGLGGGIAPHLLVHGGRHGHGRFGRETDRAQEIVGAALRQARHEIGAGRRHQHRIGPAREFDVTHAGLGAGIEQLLIHRVAAHRLKG